MYIYVYMFKLIKSLNVSFICNEFTKYHKFIRIIHLYLSDKQFYQVMQLQDIILYLKKQHYKL